MKNIVLIAGLLYILLNTVAAVILKDDYDIFRVILVYFSILTTTAVIYILFILKNTENGRTILTFVFSLTGIFKIALSLLSPSTFNNNYSIILILGLIIIDIIILMVKAYGKQLLNQ
jgi:hypothetical protein